MTTPKHSKQTKVQVRKWHIESMSANFARLVSADYRMTHKEERCHVVTGFSGSSSQLKRLVEIAGMDEAAFNTLIVEAYFDGIQTNKGIVEAMRETLGLGSQSRKGKVK